MSVLNSWIETGWIAFAALAFLWVETAILCLLSKTPGARFKALAGGALAGSFLMIALGLALRGQDPLWVVLFLTLSLVGHVLDVAARLRNPPQHSAASPTD